MNEKQKLVLKVYVNGMTQAARTAIENLEEVCLEYRDQIEYSIEVIDIRKHPDLAEKDRIIATPTVIKQLPPPMRRIIGDLSEREPLLAGLDLLEG
ncbi:MAG: circadian clock KaiB family protein [Pseudohongiellaceae bacterium]